MFHVQAAIIGAQACIHVYNCDQGLNSQHHCTFICLHGIKGVSVPKLRILEDETLWPLLQLLGCASSPPRSLRSSMQQALAFLKKLQEEGIQRAAWLQAATSS